MILNSKGLPFSKEETTTERKYSPYVDAVLAGKFAGQEHAGIQVNYTSAMRHADIYTCVRIIAEAIGSLPIKVYRIEQDGVTKTQVSRDSKWHKIFAERPCPHQTSQEFIETTVSNLLLHGNSYAYKTQVGNNLVELTSFRYPFNVNVDMNAEGEVYYTYTRNDRTAAQNVIFQKSELMHVKLMSPDGISGYSPIRQAAEDIGISIANSRYTAKTFENGVMTSGVLSLGNDAGDTLSDEQYSRLQDSYKDFQGVKNSGKILILEGGANYQGISMSHQEAQVLELAQFSRQQIASLYKVPVHMLGDTSAQTFNNVENNNLQFLRQTLVPLITRLETAFNEMLPDNHCVKFDTHNYLRGDSEAMIKWCDGLAKLGAISVNEIREQFGMNPVDGADVYQVMTNNAEFGTWEEAEEIRQERREREQMSFESQEAANNQQLVMNEQSMNQSSNSEAAKRLVKFPALEKQHNPNWSK